MTKRKYTDEQLIEAVKNCNSYEALFRALNLSKGSGRSVKRIKKYISELNIDTSHFHGQENYKHNIQSKEELNSKTYARRAKKKDQYKTKRKEWELKNKDKLISYRKEYEKRVRDKPHSTLRRFNYSIRTAKDRQIIWKLSFDEYQILISRPCHYCSYQLGEAVLKGCGLDRLDNQKGYILDNCVSCCAFCNFIKQDLLSADEMKKVAALLIGLRKNTQPNQDNVNERVRLTNPPHLPPTYEAAS